jgi:hypothetical protein
VLTKRVHFIIQPDIMWRSLGDGGVSMVEHILSGVPGETIITDEHKEEVRFNAADDYKSFISVVTHHSYLLVDGTYRQELGSETPVDEFLRAAPPSQPMHADVKI